MKKKYYVHTKAQSNGDHEVHKQDCTWLPLPENRVYLGEFSNCFEAVIAARRHYTDVDGCHYCSRECDHH
jgi:hypothetical protein